MLECQFIGKISYKLMEQYYIDVDKKWGIVIVTDFDVDDEYVDDKGTLDIEKAGLLAYAHGHYYTLGRKVGRWGA